MFSEALLALGELLSEGAGEEVGEPASAAISVQAGDQATLLAEWLAELAYLAESDGLIPRRAETLEVGETALEATVSGARGSPAHLVKAVTYHRLEMRQQGERWRASVVLDV